MIDDDIEGFLDILQETVFDSMVEDYLGIISVIRVGFEENYNIYSIQFYVLDVCEYCYRIGKL